MSEGRLYIREVAKLIDRRESTVRSWCSQKLLPAHLRPQRDGALGWRYWTAKQVDGIREWMKTANRQPGAGLVNFTPTPEQSEGMLEQLRRPRS